MSVQIRKVKLNNGKTGYVDQNGNQLIMRVRKDGSCVFFDVNNNAVAEYPAGTVKVPNQQMQPQQGIQQKSAVQNLSANVEQTDLTKQNNAQHKQQDIENQNSKNTDNNILDKNLAQSDGISWEQKLREQAKDDKEYKAMLKAEDKKRFARAKKEFKAFDSKKKVQGKGFKLNIDKRILIGIGAAIGLIIILFGVKKILGGKKITPYNMADSILTNELGTYRFQFDIATSALGDTVTTLANQAESEQISDAEKMFNGENPYEDNKPEDSTEESTEATQDGLNLTSGESSEWDLLNKKADWTYPKYSVVIEGSTNSVDPLSTHFVVNIKTAYTDNKFTEVFVKDGKTYIEIGAIKSWLAGSNDAYLESLAENLPDGVGFVQMNDSDLHIYSRFAEDGERDVSGYTNFRALYKEKATEINSIFKGIEGAVGKKGLKADTSNGSVDLEGADAQKAFAVIKNLNNNYISNYGSIYTGLKSQELINDKQLEQAVREQDNRLTAHNSVNTFFLNNKIEDMAPVITMSASKGDEKGIAVLESALDVKYIAENRNNEITIKLRRTGNNVDFEVPTDNLTPLENLVNLDSTMDVIYAVVDYFNISPLTTSKQLELSPSNILDDMLSSFATMVNKLGTYPVYLTKDNMASYISEFKGKDLDKATSEEEANNIKIVASIIDTMNNYGFSTGVSTEEETNYLSTVEQYPTAKGNINGVEYAIKVNANESNGKLLVLDGVFTNSGVTDIGEPVADTVNEETDDTEITSETSTLEETSEEESSTTESATSERKVDYDEEYSVVGDIEDFDDAMTYIIDVNNGALSEENKGMIKELYDCATNKEGSGAYKGIYEEHKSEVNKMVDEVAELRDSYNNLKDSIETTVNDANKKTENSDIEEGLENLDEALNDSDSSTDSVHINISDFSVRTLLSSIYPINNDIKILEYDNKFDVTTLVKEIDVAPNETTSVKMYCILDDDDGHLDLFYNNTQVGVVVEY